jgi:DNA-binding MarR family transcriptional regulator
VSSRAGRAGSTRDGSAPERVATPSDPVGSAAEAALEALSFGLVAVTARAIEDVTTHGQLSFQQWRVLVVLASPARLRVTELARRIGASEPSTSRMADRLERRGLIETIADPLDRRAINLRLTPAGSTLRDEVVERRRALIAESIAGLSVPPDGVDTIERFAEAFERWV